MSRSGRAGHSFSLQRRTFQSTAVALAALVLAATAAVAGQVDYTYDDLGRLKTVTYDDGSMVEYNYDPAGNRTSQIMTVAGDNPINDTIPTLGVGNNLLDISGWPVGSAPTTTPALTGWATSTSYTNEARWSRVTGPGSSGQVTTLETGQTETDPNGGGFNPSSTFTIDPTKAYEFSIYFQKHDLSRQNLYLGTRTGGAVKHSINDAVYTNPYFLAWGTPAQQANLDADTWYKIVGYVLPEGYPTVASYADWGGVYNVSTGVRVANTTPFRWNEARTTNSMYARFFTYYDEAQQNVFTNHFYQPEVRVTNVSYTPVVPVLSITHSDATEGGNITFNVNLSAPTTVDIKVDYSVGAGTPNGASSGDYTASSDTLVIPKGNTLATISVPTTADAIAEVDESVQLTLSSPVRATLSESSETAFIIDDDSSAGFSINNVSVSEGGSLSFTVTKTGSTVFSHSVSYATANGTADASDYTTKSGTLTFASSETTKTVSVVTTQDALYENNETLYLNLSSATNGATISVNQGVGTITNDDPTPAFMVSDASVSEGGNLSFSITRLGSTAKSHSVSYATANGSAGASDYTSKSGTLTFASGETPMTKTVGVVTSQDVLYENNETLYVNLSSATNGATMFRSQGVGTISNDDAAPAFTINNVSAEEGNSLTFAVNRFGPTALSHNVNYATANGTAAAGSDYTAKSGTLTFTSGQTSQTVTITGIEDATPESSETFNVNLSAATNGATIGDSQGVGTIYDDDVANSPPVAVADLASMSVWDTIYIVVLANDSDPDGDSLTITSVTQPTGGLAAIVPTQNTVVIQFTAITVGTKVFSYTVSDGNGGTDTGTVNVSVTGGGGEPL